MMELAKQALEEKGYSVIGGYFSPCHDDYISKKPFFTDTAAVSVYHCQEKLSCHPWLMVDPFEALYTRSTINFTEVIERLGKYLKKHVGEIQVAYVYGADNAEFSYCFEQKGIGICVNRDGYQDDFERMKRTLSGSHNLFIENNSTEASFSSRKIRCMKENVKNPIAGTYLIRNEGILPLRHLLRSYDECLVDKAQKEFLASLEILIQEFLPTVETRTIDIWHEISYAEEILNGSETISMDVYFKGQKISR